MEERHDLLLAAVETVLLPLARLCLAQGLPIDRVEEALKRAYVQAARERRRESGAAGGRDVSQISTATGLSRREVARLDAALVPRRVQKPSFVHQIYLRWSTAKKLRDSHDRPRALPRAGKAPSFESVARSITRHVHSRSLLDEMLRLGLVRLADDVQTVHLVADAYVPTQDDAQLYALLGANVGDHLAAAGVNVTRRERTHFEQAIYADELSQASAEAVRAIAARQWQRVLAEVVPELERLIARDKAAGRETKHRARIGLFSFQEEENDHEDDPSIKP